MSGERAPETAAVWQPRPWQALGVRAAIAIAPVALAAAASLVLGRVVAYPDDGVLQAGWWLGLMVATSAGLVVFDRAARRFLPLASLLSLTLVFPDRAPSRFRVALRSGSTRHLQRLVAEAQHDEVPPDAARAAEWVLGLVAALSHHDRTTRGHSERVRAYTDLIAEEMGLDEDRRNRLRWAALLHDVGKLRTPREVLNNTGAPSDAEWELLKRHPVDGLQLCWPLQQWLGDALGAVVHHHERVDGRGYPHGVSGARLGWAARIVTVADCYDVMTSVRSYKKAMPASAARAELARCAGTQFDPVVVRAFLNVSLGRTRFVAGPLAALVNLPFVGGAVSATTATTAALPATVATMASGALLGGAVVAVAPPEPVQVWASTIGASADPLPSVGTTVTSAPAGRPPITVQAATVAPTAGATVAARRTGSVPSASAAGTPTGIGPVDAGPSGTPGTGPATTGPGTTSPGTTSPGTTSPGTTGPGTTSPGTTSPGTTGKPGPATTGPVTAVGPSSSSTPTTTTTTVAPGPVPFADRSVALAGAAWDGGSLVFAEPQGSALTRARYASAGLEATFEVSVARGDALRPARHGLTFAFVPPDRAGQVGAGGSGLGWGGLGGLAIGFLLDPVSGRPGVVVARGYDSSKGLIVSSQAELPASTFEVKVVLSATKRVRVSIDGKQVLDVTVAELPAEGSVGFTGAAGSSTSIRIEDVKIRAARRAAPGPTTSTGPSTSTTRGTTAPAKPVDTEID